jgi:hypothetical protein
MFDVLTSLLFSVNITVLYGGERGPFLPPPFLFLVFFGGIDQIIPNNKFDIDQ